MIRRATALGAVEGPQRARGIAAVEFVVTAPFLLMLMLGTAEIGRAFIQYVTLTYAVRTSARYLSENALTGTTGVVGLTATTINRARNLAVYGNVLGTGPARLPQMQTSQVQVVDAGGDNVRVSIVYPYQPMLGNVMPGLQSGGSIPLNFNMQVAVTVRAIS